jgi:hypothetical protein
MKFILRIKMKMEMTKRRFRSKSMTKNKNIKCHSVRNVKKPKKEINLYRYLPTLIKSSICSTNSTL